MSAAATAYAAYRTAGVRTLNQRDLIVKLYQGAEGFVETGAADMEAGESAPALIAIRKAKHIFVELLSTLDVERGGEVAHRLRGLYSFFIGQLVEAGRHQKPGLLRELLPIIADLRSAYQGIPEELANSEGSLADRDGQVVDRLI